MFEDMLGSLGGWMGGCLVGLVFFWGVLFGWVVTFTLKPLMVDTIEQ